MKKKVLIVFLVFILLAQLLSACSPSTLKEGEKKTEEAKNEEVTVAEIKEDTEKATEAEVKEGSEVGEEKSEWLTMVPNHDYKSSEFAVGPNGEDAVPADEIELTDEQYEAIKEKKLKAVLLWAGAGEWYNAMTDGAKEEFKKLGIEVAAISDADFDPATQATQIETALALNPDIIIGTAERISMPKHYPQTTPISINESGKSPLPKSAKRSLRIFSRFITRNIR